MSESTRPAQPIVQTTDGKTGAAQYWGAEYADLNLMHTSHILSDYGKEPDFRKIRTELKKIDAMTFSSVSFIALREDAQADTRLNYRGYDGDTAPLVIRKVELPELKCIIQPYREDGHQPHSSKDDTKRAWFTSLCNSYSFPQLSDNDRKILQERFGLELIRSATPALLRKVQTWARKWTISYPKTEIANYKRQLTELNAFRG